MAVLSMALNGKTTIVIRNKGHPNRQLYSFLTLYIFIRMFSLQNLV